MTLLLLFGAGYGVPPPVVPLGTLLAPLTGISRTQLTPLVGISRGQLPPVKGGGR